MPFDRRLLWTLNRVNPTTQWVLGVVLFPIGLAVTAVTLYAPSLALFLAGGVLAGAGAGLLFKGGVARAAMAAQPRSRAGVLAWFFVIAYVGMGLPSVVFAAVITVLPIAPTMIGFAVLFAAAAILVVGGATRERSVRD